MYELALATDVQTKLRQTIKDAIEENNGKITYDWVGTLCYFREIL